MQKGFAYQTLIAVNKTASNVVIRKGWKLAIVAGTNLEYFGSYKTKKELLADAKKYGIAVNSFTKLNEPMPKEILAMSN